MRTTKKLIGFTILGVSVYLAYRNMDKIRDMIGNMTHMMDKEYQELEDML